MWIAESFFVDAFYIGVKLDSCDFGWFPKLVDPGASGVILPVIPAHVHIRSDIHLRHGLLSSHGC